MDFKEIRELITPIDEYIEELHNKIDALKSKIVKLKKERNEYLIIKTLTGTITDMIDIGNNKTDVFLQTDLNTNLYLICETTNLSAGIGCEVIAENPKYNQTDDLYFNAITVDSIKEI